MALSADEQGLYDWLRSTLPGWFFATDTEEEIWGAAAKALHLVRAQADSWLAATYVLDADGVWLDQHARDRGTFRQANEPEDILRERLRSVADAVAPGPVLAAVQAVLTLAGVVGTAYMLELRRDRAHFNVITPISSGGSGLSKAGTTMTLITGYTWTGREVGREIQLVGSTSPGNDGTFTITDVTGDHTITFTNPAGVTEVYGGVWTLDGTGANRKHAYLSRGYRMGSMNRPSSFTVILPYGTDVATAAAVDEALRQYKPGGFKSIVERRANP